MQEKYVESFLCRRYSSFKLKAFTENYQSACTEICQFGLNFCPEMFNVDGQVTASTVSKYPSDILNSNTNILTQNALIDFGIYGIKWKQIL